MSAFSSTPLLPTLVESLSEQGLVQPTEVQSQTLKPLLDGRCLLGVSETGSGKTLAYVLPMLHSLKTLELNGSSVSKPRRPRGLILVPGRELGEQVSRVLKGLTHRTRLRVRTVLGGSAKKVARRSVAAPFEILVATPGRLTQLLDSGDLSLKDVRTLVIDEADQMVDPGFLPVAQRILKSCPPKVQVVLFSATLPSSLDGVISSLFPSAPVRVRTHGSTRLVATLKTINRNVVGGDRKSALLQVLSEGASSAGTMVFVNTRAQLDRVSGWLSNAGLAHSSYRGQMERQERRISLAKFRSGEVDVLITTDLGGRGLDIERVERVVNVHLPKDLDNYLHRVGRTARAGRAGVVVNLVTQRDHLLLTKVRRREERARR
ncbi:MAG: DEAD/DEAH box helicase [Myxococcota bacterium]|nr:DEAD/DEAH box helicase [Myxococcota bacterium]